MFFEEAESKNPACWGRRREVRFFPNFFAKFKLIIVSIFLGKFCGVTSNMRFIDTVLISFFMFKGLFLHL